MNYTTLEIAKRFGVHRSRIAQIAHARKWRYKQIGSGRNPARLYEPDDVEAEAAWRKRRGLKA